MSQTWTIAWILASALAVSAISVFIWKKTKRSFVQVGRISKIFFYPVKSLKAVEVREGKCTKLGLEVNGLLDRSFMVINAEAVLVSQREEPSLVLLTPSVSANNLSISAPNGEELMVEIKDDITPDEKIITCKVHGDNVNAVDCGDDAAAFFQRYLQKPNLRLVRYFPSLPERKYRGKDPFYSKIKKDHPIGFQDLAAIHIVSQASIEDLNSKLEGHNVTALNFRPNILINGCTAFEEDSWMYIKFNSGAKLFNLLTTTRCLMTTNDPNTGILSQKEPLVTLRKYRIHSDPAYLKKTGPIPCMGVSNAVLKPGIIKVGEEILAVVGPQPSWRK